MREAEAPKTKRPFETFSELSVEPDPLEDTVEWFPDPIGAGRVKKVVIRAKHGDREVGSIGACIMPEKKIILAALKPEHLLKVDPDYQGNLVSYLLACKLAEYVAQNADALEIQGEKPGQLDDELRLETMTFARRVRGILNFLKLDVGESTGLAPVRDIEAQGSLMFKRIIDKALKFLEVVNPDTGRIRLDDMRDIEMRERSKKPRQ